MSGDDAPGRRGRGILRPLGWRDFRLLWMGQTVSLLGNGVTTVALAWQAYELSPRATSLSLVLLARAVPMIGLLLVGGVVTDRLPRRAVMLASDIARLVAVATISVLAFTGTIELWHLTVLAAVFGAAEAFFQPAYSAIYPEVLPPDLLLPANALDSAVRPIAFHIAGPALGGFLIAATGTAAAFAVDAATFAASAAFLVAMRHYPAPARSGTKVMAELREGFAYTRSQPWLWATLLSAAATILFALGPIEVLIPLIVRDRLGAGAVGFGLVNAALGVGGLAAAVIAGQIGIPRRRVTAMYFGWGIGVLLCAALAYAPALAVAMAIAAAIGYGFELGTVIWRTLMQELVPGRMLGRVSALDWLVSFALAPVSYALTGPIAEGLGASATLALGGVLGAAMTFAFLFWPGVRDPERRATVPALE